MELFIHEFAVFVMVNKSAHIAILQKSRRPHLIIIIWTRPVFCIALFSPLFRMEVEYEPSSTQALLRISPVEIEDDADYKCEITYWEVREHCDIVQIIKLTTLGELFLVWLG